MKLISTTTMNNRHEGDARKFIAESEAHYQRQLESAVREIASEEVEKPVILLSGPSGSGKTTTAFRIRKMLDAAGIKTYTMSMDNYFIPMNDPRTVYEPDGSVDFESPNRLETEQLADHLEKMWSGEEFTLPVFDFVNQKQLAGERFKRHKHEMVILEGIHALNPAVTGLVSEHSSGVYVSVRTRVKSRSGKLLHPSKIRLTRRLIRDKLFRGRSVEHTLQYFAKVGRGEKKYITPYKCYAEHHIDTFMAYELAAYKDYILPELAGIEEGADLLTVLSELDAVAIDDVPRDSLLREFVGDSEFEY
jgi:uridine kinase